jgi:hypothetical protein
MLLKSRTSATYEPKAHDLTVEFIKDIYRTQVLETEDMEVDSPSMLNVAMNESAWAQVPFFAHEPSGYHAIPRDVLPIEKELDTWLNHTPHGEPYTDIDILAYWKDQ